MGLAHFSDSQPTFLHLCKISPGIVVSMVQCLIMRQNTCMSFGSTCNYTLTMKLILQYHKLDHAMRQLWTFDDTV